MLAFRKYVQSEEGMVETKSFAYRIRDLFRRKSRKSKIDSNLSVYSMLRVNTDLSSNCSCIDKFCNKTQDVCPLVSSPSKSLELERDNNYRPSTIDIKSGLTQVVPRTTQAPKCAHKPRHANRYEFDNWPGRNEIDWNVHDALPAPSISLDYNHCVKYYTTRRRLSL